MTETSLSFLDQLCSDADNDSWHRLVDVYSPLLHGWLARYNVQLADADDLIQEVLLLVTKELPGFRHNQRPGAFRAWMRMILVHRLRRHFDQKQRRPVAHGDSDFSRQLEQLEDPNSELSRIWDKQHDRQLLLKLLELISPRFSESTLLAFRKVAIDNIDPVNVATQLGISENAVMIAKCRVLKELRREGRGLLGIS